MKIMDIPSNTAVCICEHVFEKSAPPMLFAREQTGELIATCGCEVKKAHMVGFGHLVKFFEDIKQEEIPEEGSHFEKDRKTDIWKKGVLEA